MKFTLATDGLEGVRVHAITVAAEALEGDLLDTAGVTLWRDSNGDGALDPGADRLLAGPAFLDPDGVALLVPGNAVLGPNRTECWFLAASFYDAAPAGSRFRFSIPSTSAVKTEGLLSGRAASISGVPLSGGTLTLEAPVVAQGTFEAGGGGCAPSPGAPASPAPGAVLLAAAMAASALGRKGLRRRPRPRR
jgi:hypothetical protein